MTKRKAVVTVPHMERPRTKLASVLNEQGRRQDWVATELGVSQALVTRWLNGERRISYERLSKLAKLLNVREEEIDGLIGKTKAAAK